MKPDLVWGEPLTSLPLIRKPTSGTRASNGGRKISTKTVRKKRLPLIVMSWNLVWWLTTSDYFQKCKNMEYQNSGPSGTLKKNSYCSASSGLVTFGDNLKAVAKQSRRLNSTLLYLLRNYDLQSEIEKLLLYFRKEGVISLSRVVEFLIQFFYLFFQYCQITELTFVCIRGANWKLIITFSFF